MESLAVLVADLRVSVYLTLAGCTLFAYDWVLNLGDEIELVWQGRWNTVKVLYLWNRCITPLILLMDVYDKGGLATNLTTDICRVSLYFDGWATILSLASIHWIVALRVWTLYGRSGPLLVGFLALFMLYMGATCAIFAMASIKIAKNIFPNAIIVRLCVGTIPSWMWTVWIPSLSFETFIFALTVLKALRHWRQGVETPILTVLYRDGFVYFLVISLASLFNMLVWLVAPPSMVLLSKYFTLCVVNIAAFRMVLDLRDVGMQVRAATSHPSAPEGQRSRAFDTHGYAIELSPRAAGFVPSGTPSGTPLTLTGPYGEEKGAGFDSDHDEFESDTKSTIRGVQSPSTTISFVYPPSSPRDWQAPREWGRAPIAHDAPRHFHLPLSRLRGPDGLSSPTSLSPTSPVASEPLSPSLSYQSSINSAGRFDATLPRVELRKDAAEVRSHPSLESLDRHVQSARLARQRSHELLQSRARGMPPPTLFPQNDPD